MHLTLIPETRYTHRLSLVFGKPCVALYACPVSGENYARAIGWFASTGFYVLRVGKIGDKL